MDNAQKPMISAMGNAGKRVFFNCLQESLSSRPDVMTAGALDISAVRDAELSFLRANESLRVLYLTEAYTLHGIEALSQLRELVLVHAPRLHSLTPLKRLRELQFLTVSTPPSWDASRKCHEVASLTPLAALDSLISLTLVGVRPARGGLRPLREMTGLRFLHISHVYTFEMRDYADLAAHLTGTAGPCLRPCFAMGFETPCRRCGQQMVCLTGARPRARRFLCLSCDRSRLLDHIAAWEVLTGRHFAYPQSAQEVLLEPAPHYDSNESLPLSAAD